jgi:hypothetical protein
MQINWSPVPGIVVQGYRVASGLSADYPYGALSRQKPIFKERGLDLDGYFEGTLNVSIHPRTFRLVRPEFTFRDVAWTDLHPPEHFSFSRCQVEFRGTLYDGWIYYPHPETKKRNFQDPTLLEVIARPVPGLAYEDELRVFVNPEEVEITAQQAATRCAG